MKKLSAITFLLLFLSEIFSAPVQEDIARKAAANFLQRYSRLKSAIDLGIGLQNKYNGLVTFYAFTLNSGGWILISADDAATPVLAYSNEGEWNEETMNPMAKNWIESYSKEIYNAIQSRAASEDSQKEWQLLLNMQFSETITTVSPLLTTKWDQSNYYNDMCPASSAAPYGYGGRVPTGCVATTMAQIMKYHKYPSQGIGTFTYNHPVYNSLSANFGSTDYNWNSMPDKATTSNAALATIMYHCGVAVGMNYHPQGSGAATEAVPYALTNYFNYDRSIQLVRREGVANDEIWRTLIRTELLAGRPVYYAGSGSAGGHAFVCDGFDSSNPTRFHINWGWSGNSNGYFAIGALTTSTGAFNEYNRIIINIKPRTNPGYICRIDTPADGAKVNPGEDLSITTTTLKGTTSKVFLYLDGIKKDSSLSAPFSFVVNTAGLAAGPHQLAIKATDGSGWDFHATEFNILSSCWQVQNFTFSQDSLVIEQIYPLNEQVVWAVLGDYSSKKQSLRKFIKTTDGGNTWTEGTITCSTCGSMGISNIFPISANKAYACLNPGNATGGAILVTEDGGLNWTLQSTANFAGSWANWVHFFDENNGVCMGDSYKPMFSTSYNFSVFTTNNGGTTWTRVAAPNLPVALTNEAGTVNFYDAAGNTIWFGTGNGRIFKSTDKGLTWTVKDGVLGKVQTNVRFIDVNNGIAYGGFGSANFGFKKTTDGGTTWKDALPQGLITGQDYSFVPGTDSTWINCGYYSSVSINGNRSFYLLDYTTRVNTAKFLSPSVGWGGGVYTLKNGGGIYKWNGTLEPKLNQNAVVRVKDMNGNPVRNALAMLNYQEKITNETGLAEFDVKSFGNPVNFQVSKSGYSSFSGNYIMKGSDTIDVELTPSYSVTFIVKNKLGDAVSEASVIFNGKTQVTDATGSTIFTEVAGNMAVPYAVTKNRFYAGYGITDIQTDKVMNITLITDATGFSKKSVIKNIVFPNPVSEILNVVSENPITAVEIVSVGGKMVYYRTCNSNTVQIPVSDIKAGNYLLKVFRDTEVETHKVVVKH